MSRILHIDNDSSWKSIVADTFQRDTQIEVVTASYPSDILQILRGCQYSLVVMELSLGNDLHQPVGLDIAKVISQELPEVPVLILSGVLTVDRICRAADMKNIVGVIPKQGVPNSLWLRDRIKQYSACQ